MRGMQLGRAHIIQWRSIGEPFKSNEGMSKHLPCDRNRAIHSFDCSSTQSVDHDNDSAWIALSIIYGVSPRFYFLWSSTKTNYPRHTTVYKCTPRVAWRSFTRRQLLFIEIPGMSARSLKSAETNFSAAQLFAPWNHRARYLSVAILMAICYISRLICISYFPIQRKRIYEICGANLEFPIEVPIESPRTIANLPCWCSNFKSISLKPMESKTMHSNEHCPIEHILLARGMKIR